MGKRLLFLVAALFSLFVLMALAGGCTKASVTTTTAGGGGTETTVAGGTDTSEAPDTTEAPAPDTTEAPKEEAPPAGDGKAVVEKVCTQCHGLTGITTEGKGSVPGFESFKGQMQTATPRDWEATVARMKDTNKCPMTDDEKKTIVEWLNANVK